MGRFDGLFNCDPDEKQEKPDSSNMQGSGFSSVQGADTNRWGTIDESNRHLRRDPDLMYTGPTPSGRPKRSTSR